MRGKKRPELRGWRYSIIGLRGTFRRMFLELELDLPRPREEVAMTGKIFIACHVIVFYVVISCVMGRWGLVEPDGDYVGFLM